MMTLRFKSMNARILALTLGCAASVGACASEQHGAETGTETGNPPVLDEALVALRITVDGVRIEGAKNAATPGANVEIVSALTGQVFQGRVAVDGSFGVDVSGSKLDTYAVRVVIDGKKSTKTVYVAPGAAAVESSDTDGSLSCEQRSNLARTQLDALIESTLANDPQAKRCISDSDCTTVSAGSTCSDSCAVYAITNKGAETVDAAKVAINDGLCRSFAADGCKVLALPCPFPGEQACVGHFQCQIVQRGGPGCADRPVCVNGKKQVWPSVCHAETAQEPSASINVVCLENDKGEVALASMGGSVAVTNRGWGNSAYGLFPDSLSLPGRASCTEQLAALGSDGDNALRACLSQSP